MSTRFQDDNGLINNYNTVKEDLNEDFKKKLIIGLLFGSIFGFLIISTISLFSIANSLSSIVKLMELKQNVE